MSCGAVFKSLSRRYILNIHLVKIILFIVYIDIITKFLSRLMKNTCFFPDRKKTKQTRKQSIVLITTFELWFFKVWDETSDNVAVGNKVTMSVNDCLVKQKSRARNVYWILPDGKHAFFLPKWFCTHKWHKISILPWPSQYNHLVPLIQVLMRAIFSE